MRCTLPAYFLLLAPRAIGNSEDGPCPALAVRAFGQPFLFLSSRKEDFDLSSAQNAVIALNSKRP